MGEYIGIEHDSQRRDALHATINSLPDPNYATLRALILVGYVFFSLVDIAFFPTKDPSNSTSCRIRFG